MTQPSDIPTAPARYVAVCDVLGFSHMVETTPLLEVREGYREIIQDALAAAQTRGQTIWPDGRTETHATPRVGCAVFSDSIIAWSISIDGESEPSPSACASNFFSFVGQLILRGLRKTDL